MVSADLRMQAALYTLVNGEMASSMATVMRFGPMAQSISASTATAERKVSAYLGGQTDQTTQASGSQIKFMVTDPISGQITVPILVEVLMVGSTVLGATSGPMVVNMRVNTKTIPSKGSVSTHGLRGRFSREIGSMVHNTTLVRSSLRIK